MVGGLAQTMTLLAHSCVSQYGSGVQGLSNKYTDWINWSINSGSGTEDMNGI